MRRAPGATGSPRLRPVEGAPGELIANLVGFARLLRAAGMPVGPDRVLEAVRTAALVGLERRDDFYWALHAVFVSRRDEQHLFERAFALFWRERGGLEDALAALLPRADGAASRPSAPTPRRLAEAWGRRGAAPAARDPAEPLADAAGTASAEESLRSRDFAEMSAAELREAANRVARLSFAAAERPTRRLRRSARGPRVDPRASLRASLRGGGAGLPLRFSAPRTRTPPLVLLCDVSGSMERYSRMLLLFAHALCRARAGVHVFVFGTRLTDATRTLRGRDVDLALAKLGHEVSDWSGGTRIGDALRRFNFEHARRVLGHGATVLLVTDGLERADSGRLAGEAERLRRHCARLVWLDPLLRYARWEPLAAGPRVLLPRVDEHRRVHDLRSLKSLADALGDRAP